MKVLSPKHYVKTRWLSMGESLKRIFEIWDSLSKCMACKPCFGVSTSKYDDFIELLESKKFKTEIQVLTAIINKLNLINIRFQEQTLEIQHIKLEIQRFIKFLCNLYMKSKFHPDFNKFNKEDWNSWKNQSIEEESFLSSDEFLSNLVTDLDFTLNNVKLLDLDDQENLAIIFQPFLAEITSLLVSYFPLSDGLINSLDFVTLNLEPVQLKKNILTFNDSFKIVPQEKINELSEEISRLNEENLTLLRKDAKKSSIYLWDLVTQTSEQYENGETIYKHLSKIFTIAHALPTSSAPVEQTFSCLKLVMNDLRSRLNEETAQALIMINEEFRNGKSEISEEMLKMFEINKNEMISEKIQIKLKNKNSITNSINDNSIINNSNRELSDSPTSTKKRKEEGKDQNLPNYCLKKLKTNLEQNSEEGFSLGDEGDSYDFSDYSYQEIEESLRGFEEFEGQLQENQSDEFS